MFLSRNKKNIDTFWLKKAPYQELCVTVYLYVFILSFINSLLLFVYLYIHVLILSFIHSLFLLLFDENTSKPNIDSGGNGHLRQNKMLTMIQTYAKSILY